MLLQIDPWRLEALKRRLHALPHWLDEARCVRVVGAPPLQDIEGQFRLAGLRSLLAGLGARQGGGAACAVLWLGHGAPPEAASRVLLWPPPGRPLPRSHGTVLPLPDPMHALWGLLDHHPQGQDVLALPAEPDWRPLLPMLARLPAWLPVPGRLRQALLNRAQRLVRAHAEVSAPRAEGSILAALLGREVRLSPAAEAYWSDW